MKYDNIVQTSNKTKGTNTCEYIVLHHTGGGDYSSNLKVLSGQTSRKVSCHYLVGIDGKLAKIGQDTDILRHCGESERQGKKYMNRYAIGIEIINVGQSFTNAQRVIVRDVINDLIKKHNIAYQNILRHKDVSPGRKVDVYDEFWNNEYKTFVDYQISFKKEVDPIVQKALIGNSDLRHYTNDIDLRKQLNKTNEMIRKLYL